MASSTCQPSSDSAFGPRIDPTCRSFDFTLLFEDIFFVCLPAAVFLALLPSNITVLARSRAVCSVRSKLLLAKLIALAGVLTTQVVLLVLRLQNAAFKTGASLTADVLSIVGIVGVAWLSYVDHQRSLRPSTLLSLYLSVIVILGIARVRTLWLIDSTSGPPAALTANFVLTWAALFIESTEKKSSLKEGNRSHAPEEYSGFWARTAFSWLVATFRAGYAKIITLDDLPKLDSKLESHTLRGKLVKTWSKYDHKKRHSLVQACFHENAKSFLSGVPPRLLKSFFYLMMPLLINTTVSYVGEDSPNASYGNALIGAWALVFLGLGCSTGLASYQNSRFITRLKGGLIGLVYQETLKARTADLGGTTAIALMGTDIERIGQQFLNIHEVYASFIEIGVSIWLLERQVFLACLAPIFLIIVSAVATVPVAARVKVAQKSWIEKVEIRLRVTSATLDDMKAVKMLGLSGVMSNIILGLRNVEIQTSKVYRQMMVYILLLSNTPMDTGPLFTFTVFSIIAIYWKDGSLLAAQAFTSVALITLLMMPVLMMIQVLPQLIGCIGSFDRIQEYCNYAEDSPSQEETLTIGEKNDSSISLQSLTGHDSDSDRPKHVITLNNQSYAWAKDKPAVLKDIELRVARGEFAAIVGPVGSGKTMLLESILGETIMTSGTRDDRTVSMAYCAHQPWLENGTIRSNIIGISAYDQKWYRTVKTACGLEEDLQSLVKNDHTVIGSKGINLSGGQRQRIALARAVYSRQSIVLLDDVFSGMDAHTVDTVSRRLLGGNGLLRTRGTTVVLATHSHKLMTLADTLIALEDGKIVETGSPQTLLSNSGYVAKLGLSLRSQEALEDQDEINRAESLTVEKSTSTALSPEADEEDNDPKRKNGEWSVYSYYFSSSGWGTIALFIVGIAIWIFSGEFPIVWLDWWSAANEIEPNKDIGMYLGVYAAICVVGIIAVAGSCWLGFVKIVGTTSHKLHYDLLQSTMRAPLRFFSATDTGTLTNRFSQDMELLDMNLPIIMVNYIVAAFTTFAKAIILMIFSKYLAITMPFVLVILYVLQVFYLQTSRQVRLLEIEAKAPLYTHFTESVAGAATIRAFGWQSHYQQRNYRFIDSSLRPAYLQYCIQHWLSFVLDMIVTALAIILVAIVVTWRDKFSAGSVGVSLVMVTTFNIGLMRLIKMWTMMESSIGAVARVKRFVASTDSEETSGWTSKVADNWPTQGNVEFRGLIAAYKPEAAPVIKGLSLLIKPSEHVAICGRSGSGKSSLILALLQLIEIEGGQILVDDVDISTVPGPDVRSQLNVVPQDPFLIPGTIRFNIDPFGKASEKDVISALDRVRLWPIVQEQGGLDKEMDTAAWSAGQKQLLCLARAIVKDSKILILDEATSSVDSETESIMQEIIDTVFKDCTVLAVMHRLKHVTKYDKVALLDDGNLLEFDAPSTLLSQDSRFAGLHQSSAK